VTATAPFGRSGPGLLQRLRPVRIDPVDLRETADSVLPDLAEPGLRLAVLDLPTGGAVLTVEEAERRVRERLGDHADDMTRAGVPATPDGIAEALVAWVAHRPVTDDAAVSGGVAVLDWTDPGHTAIGWSVLVPRGALALRWTPSPGLPDAGVADVRAAAAARARRLDLELRVEGPVALWSHPLVPGLASAVLAAPERMRDLVAAAGLALPEMHVVVTPHRPVACAGPGVAARLAGQTTEDRVVLSWAELPDLRWIRPTD
jgi:hypothetical protein